MSKNKNKNAALDAVLTDKSDEIKTKAAKPPKKVAAKAEKAVTKPVKAKPAKAVKSAKVAKATDGETGRSAVNERVMIPTDKYTELRENTNRRIIVEAFKGGKTIADAVADLSLSLTPPRSKRFQKNSRAFLLGGISWAVKNGHLEEKG